MTESMHRVRVALKLPQSVPGLLTWTRAVLTAMQGNPSFPAPQPSLDAVASALAALDQAETRALSRTRGTREARDEQRAALVALLGALRGYVQSVADASPEHAVSVIEGAGMRVRQPAVYTKPAFEVRAGRVSGSVVLAVIAAGDRAAYRWQWSTHGGLTWHDAPRTTQAKTEVAGLPMGKTCDFRVQVVTRDREQDWSEPRSSVVT
jgi:hypothetical protein